MSKGKQITISTLLKQQQAEISAIVHLIEEIDIITRDHETRFDTLENIFKLENIEAQEIY